MPDVGVRELKQRLSEYLDRAERGEVLRVTDRGRPKAVLGPLPGRARIEEGVAEGWITAGPVRDFVLYPAGRRAGAFWTFSPTIVGREPVRRFECSAEALHQRSRLRRGQCPTCERRLASDRASHDRRGSSQTSHDCSMSATRPPPRAFLEDIAAFGIVELDGVTCEAAADIAELTGARTLDALHLAAARRIGGAAVPFVTFDLRQAQAARILGLAVLPS